MTGDHMARLPGTPRRVLKWTAHALCLLLVAPAGIVCWLEHKWSKDAEAFFSLFAQAVALLPGYAGVCVRRAYYAWTLEECAHDFFIGFGALFTHRQASVEQGVYIGNFTLIGCATLRKGCLIGGHASLLSGPSLHEPDPVAGWLPFDPALLQRIEIGEQAWIGERSVVIADLGARAMAAAGSVVSAPVPAGIMVAGNPARYVRRVHAERPVESIGRMECVR